MKARGSVRQTSPREDRTCADFSNLGGLFFSRKELLPLKSDLSPIPLSLAQN